MKCKLCDFTASNPYAIGVHRRADHGIKPARKKRVKESPPPELTTGPQLAEEELLANVVGWFEQAQQTPEACGRIVDYLRARYTVPELKMLFARGSLAPSVVTPANGTAAAHVE